MKLFPVHQLHSSLTATNDSDFWEQCDVVVIKDEVIFPKDDQKSREEIELTDGGGHISAIVYEETKLKAEGQFFTQRDLESLGVKSRPVAASPFEKHFPMYLIRGSVLKQQTRILKHEEMLAQNLLTEVKEFSYINLRVETTAQHYIQDPDDERSQNFGVFLPILASGKILKPWKRIVFISHRWLNPLGSPPHPDDDANTKLKQLKEIIRDDDYVMMDYMSFPQNDYDGQGRAIKSLCWYVYHCSNYRIISPDSKSFEEFLGRGWCQLELLSAFCPVLSKTEAVSDGNFYLDFEETRINQFYVCAATDRALILGNSNEFPLKLTMVRNPKQMNFSVPEDATKVQGLLNTIIAAFKQGLPRKEHVSDGQGKLTSSQSVTHFIKFEEVSKTEVEELLQALSI